MSRQDKNMLAGVVAAGFALFGLYMLIYLCVFRLHPPKTAALLEQKARWEARVGRLCDRMDRLEQNLDLLELRDNRIYRPAYGMETLSDSARTAGRIVLPEGLDSTSMLASALKRSQTILRREWAQSESYGQVEKHSRGVDIMASHIPAIPPMNPDPKKYRFSSPYGYRRDPIHGQRSMHMGIDFGFAANGNPIYCTGDGEVSLIREDDKGYGHQVMVDHGYGYKTRYAHLSHVFVFEGMKLKRGDCVGVSGSTGRSTGPHVHYEVFYDGETTDPLPFMDLTISPDIYFQIVRKPRGR